MQNGHRLFSDWDLRLFRATAVLAAVAAFAGLVVLILWTLGQVLSHFYNLLLPLSVAAVFALVLYPVVRWFEQWLGVSRLWAVILLFLVMLCVLVGVFWLVLPAIINQSNELMRVGPELLAQLQEMAHARFPGITDAVASYVQRLDFEQWSVGVEKIVSQTMSYGGLLVGLGFVPLYLFFMLVTGSRIKQSEQKLISVLNSRQQHEVVYLTRSFVGYVTAFFQGQLIIAIIMAFMLAAGFTLIGLKGAIVLGILLGLLNIVPFLGTIVGLLVTLPIAWIQPGGGLSMIGLTLLVFAIVQLIESWVLTPRIMSQKSGLHPAVVVISLFFWGLVFGGVIGMILAVPLSAFLISAWGHMKSRYMTSVVTESDDAPIEADS